MVDRADLPKINALYGERNNIMRVIELFDEGGRIIGLTVGKQSEGEPKFWQFTAQANTEEMAYPPQMVEAIKGFLNQRETEIANELAALGVTGVEAGERMVPRNPEPAAAAPRAAAKPAAAPPKPAPRRK